MVETKALITLPVVHPNAMLTIGDQTIPHQGLTLEWSLDNPMWTAVVRIPVILSEDMDIHSAAYVVGGDSDSTTLRLIEEQGDTPGLALYALARAVVREEDSHG